MSIVNHKKINSNMPVGFFDSGVGGLSVYSKFRKILPTENTLYFGDLLHLPYGNKTKEELIRYARGILGFYQKKGVKSVVIACNTSSAQAYDSIKDEYDFKIYPIIQSCARVIAEMPLKKIAVFATQATVNSKVYSQELRKYNKNLEIIEIACPDWVEIVENGELGTEKALGSVRRHIEELRDFCPEKIILGCTHYPYLLSELTNFMPKNSFIDPAEVFVNYIKNDKEFCINNSSENGSEEFFVSANPDNFVVHSKMFYDVKKKPVLVNLDS